jgi:CDP-2,3-bis-(O-geranylgeranyl)-sn-glycerol synthase
MAFAQVLAMLTLANGVPVLAKKVLGDHFAWPLDFGLELPDGRRLFGVSKTIRGALLAVGACWASAPLFGLQANLGLQIAVLAMAGDLLTSFLKRRLNWPPSSRALGLDQIPESLLPLLSCVGPLGLTLSDVTAGTIIFFTGELLISRLLFWLHVRDQPY